MGRKIRTTLPTLEKNLLPKWPNRKTVKQKDASEKAKQAFYYNRRHGARHLPARQPGDTVYTKLDHEKAWKTPEVVSKECVTPRSYLINTQEGSVLRRNRLHLQAEPTLQPAPAGSAGMISQPVSVTTPETVSPKPSEVTTPPHTQTQVLTRSGRVSKPAAKLDLERNVFHNRHSNMPSLHLYLC